MAYLFFFFCMESTCLLFIYLFVQACVGSQKTQLQAQSPSPLFRPPAVLPHSRNCRFLDRRHLQEV